MGDLFSDFFSHKALFLNLFNTAAKNLGDMAAFLVRLLHDDTDSDREAIFKQLRALKNHGDEISGKVYTALDKVYFTPFNRKDIHSMISAIDDVADNIHEAGGRLYLYQPKELIPDFARMADYILKACTELEVLISQMGSRNAQGAFLSLCKQIKDYEGQADTVYYHALANLFMHETDAIELIKYHDILHSMEKAVNKCKSVTNIIEVALLSN